METEIGGPSNRFPETSWSILGRAREKGASERREALERLVALYWKPVYCVIRHGWNKPNEEAKDLTQDFFSSMVLESGLLEKFSPERGSFHVFLKAAVTNFMRDAAKTAGRLKRGGGRKMFSLEMADVDLGDLKTLAPEEVFDKAWKHVIFSRAIEMAEQRLASEGKQAYFEVFRRYELEPESATMSYRTLGEALGLSETTVQNYLNRAREEFRRAVIELVSDTVDNPAELTREVRWLYEH